MFSQQRFIHVLHQNKVNVEEWPIYSIFPLTIIYSFAYCYTAQKNWLIISAYIVRWILKIYEGDMYILIG